MSNIDPVAERIARKIEDQMRFEGVRAQRILKLCAYIARQEGARAIDAHQTPTGPLPTTLDESTRRILRIEDVSEMTGVSVNTLRFWRHEGKGPLSAKMGRRIVYRESDVRAWIETQFGKGVGGE